MKSRLIFPTVFIIVDVLSCLLDCSWGIDGDGDVLSWMECIY